MDWHESILENVPCAIERNVYSAAFEWSALYISINGVMCYLRPGFLVVFCLGDLSTEVSGV